MGYDLGTAKGTITLDYNGNGAAQRASADLDKVRSTGDKTGPALSKVSTAAGVAGAGIAAGLLVAVRSAANFEKGLSGIQAVSGATVPQMDAVRAKALQLGADTAFSASDASTAMEELVKAGISIPDVLNGAADSVVSLAAAGGIELPAAATIAANAMNQFGLSANEMPKIADKIAGAANASAIDVGDFGQSMTQVGAVAHLAGLSFDDTALAITAMGNAGIKGSDAGTSLKTMLQNLQPSTKKQSELMKELGIITADGSNKFFDANGKIKSMSEIAGVLGGALEGMSDAQKTATLETLFGSDAIRAAAVIAGEGAAGMDSLAASINKTSAADVAKVRMQNLSGQVEQLKGSAETLAINLGSVLIPALTSIVSALTQATNWFVGLGTGTQKAIVGVLAFVASALLIGAAIIKAVMFVKELSAALTVLRTAMASTWVAALGPIALVIAAIVAIGAALILLYNKNETFRNMVNAAWAGIKTAISAVATWITGTVWPGIQAAWTAIASGATALWTAIVAAWNGIKAGITAAVAGITALISTVWNGIKTIISTVMAAIVAVITAYVNIWRTILTTAWAGITAVISAVWAVIRAVITTAMAGISAAISGGLAVIRAIWTAVWGTFGPLVRAIGALIVAVVQLWMALIGLAIRVGMAVIRSVWTSVWNGIRAVASAVWAGIRAVITAAVNAIRAVVTSVISAIRPRVTAVWNGIRAVTSSVWSAIRSAVTSAVNAVRSVVSSVFSAIQARVSSAWSAVRSATSSAWSAIRSAVTSAVNAVRSVVSSVMSAIQSRISSGFNAARAAASSAMSALSSAVRSRMSAAVSTVRGAISSIRGVFAGAGGWLVAAGRNIIQGLIRGISSMIGKVTGMLHSLTAKIKAAKGPEKVDKVLLTDNGVQIMDSLIKGFRKRIPDVLSELGGLTVAMPETLTGSSVAVAASASRTAGRSTPVAPSAPSVGAGSPLIGVQNVYNPREEPSSQTATRSADRVAQLGGRR